MLHDIAPWKLRNEFLTAEAAPECGDDLVLDINHAGVLVRRDGPLSLPSLDEWKSMYGGAAPSLVYALRLESHFGSMTFRLALGSWDGPDDVQAEGWRRMPASEQRFASPSHLAFAAITGGHLARWYAGRKFCGKCGSPVTPGKQERSLKCPVCGRVEYPSIAPCVIVAVTDGNRLLLTTYARPNMRRYVLVAGFIEIGETAEQAAAREVMEETGLRIRNIRYCGSQPWGPGSNIALGFVADVDGSTEVRLDENELSAAEWVHRSQIPDQHDSTSLTMEMISRFAAGEL